MLEQGSFRVDQSDTFGGVFLGQQAVDGDLRIIGVSVISLSVSEYQLQRLGDRVDVLRAVVAHRFKVEVLQQIQCLLDHGRLGPGVVAENLMIFKGAGNRLAEQGLVIRQVLHGQDTADFG